MKIKIDRLKWNAFNALMIAGTKSGRMAAEVAGVGYLGSWNVEMAARQLVEGGVLKGLIESRYVGSPNQPPMSEKDKETVTTLKEAYAKDPQAFKEKTTADLNALRDMSSYLFPLSLPGSLFKPEDFKGGACKAPTWIYVARAHARGKVHLKGRTFEEQDVFVQRFIAKCPQVAALAGILLVAEEVAVAAE